MYNELIFRPLYNGLVGIMDLIPWIDVGIAVIIFTAIVKLILFPLSKSSLLTQVKMKEIEPEAAKVRAQYASDRQLQALKIMELYKSKNIKPFSGILLLFIQLPILFALISVFYKIIPTIDPQYLYSFISAPDISGKINFLGLIDLTQKSLILSLATGAIQYLQLHFSLASRPPAPAPAGQTPDMATQLSHSMSKQMKYLLPIIAFASTYWLIPAQFPQAAAIIAIYWSTSTLFTLVQELYIRKKHIGKL
ncbi:MAG: YidC/Oxa1 family membrane protein insertase [Patescibacteria group bacterium]